MHDALSSTFADTIGFVVKQYWLSFSVRPQVCKRELEPAELGEVRKLCLGLISYSVHVELHDVFIKDF